MTELSESRLWRRLARRRLVLEREGELDLLGEAQALIDQDPAVQAGHFRGEPHPLFWPALDGVHAEYERSKEKFQHIEHVLDGRS